MGERPETKIKGKLGERNTLQRATYSVRSSQKYRHTSVQTQARTPGKPAGKQATPSPEPLLTDPSSRTRSHAWLRAVTDVNEGKRSQRRPAGLVM